MKKAILVPAISTKQKLLRRRELEDKKLKQKLRNKYDQGTAYPGDKA